jgi:hypothetical protein
VAHVRKQVRDAVIGMLSGATSAAARVWPNWTIAPGVEQCPYIKVETGQGSVDRATLDDAQVRDVIVDVVLHVAVSDAADDALDALAVQVETALPADTDLGIGVSEFALSGEILDQERVNPAEVASLRMRYVARVATDGPETILAL